LGVEDWAKGTLARDLKENRHDGLSDIWTAPLPETRVPGGKLAGRIQDLQGRFNLNNLYQGGKLQPVFAAQLQRLLAILEQQPELHGDLLEWLKTKQLFSLGDKKRFIPLTHLSELMEMETMTPEIFRELSAHLVVLPEPTEVNINTATPAVLASLYQGWTLQQAGSAAERIAAKPFETLDEFLADKELEKPTLPKQHIAVSSDYFLLQAQAEMAGMEQRLISQLVRRTTGAAGVDAIYRSRDPYTAWELH
jgi:general secretion pathway protein K